MADFEKLLGVGTRIYNGKIKETKDKDGKVIANDEMALKKLVNEAYAEDCSVKSMEKVRTLNRLIIETIDKTHNPNYEQVIKALGDYNTAGRNDAKFYKIDKNRLKVKFYLSATGTGVDFNRIAKETDKKMAMPFNHQLGVRYEISEMVSDPVNYFKKVVDLLYEAKIKYIHDKMIAMAKKASTTGEIPATQVFNSTNMTLDDYRKIESVMIRHGGNKMPVLFADLAFINTLADKQAAATAGTFAKYLTDDLRESLLKDILIEQVSRSIAVPIINEFTNTNHNATDLSVQDAILIASGKEKAFQVTEFGGTRYIAEEMDIENEMCDIKLDFKMDITLLYGENIAYLHDDSVTYTF